MKKNYNDIINTSKPLVYNGSPVVTLSGRPVMDTDFIYVDMRNYGCISINVNRANYCSKIRLMELKLPTKDTTPRLKNFIHKISATRVFLHNGKSYEVMLQRDKVSGLLDLKGVIPFWSCWNTGGIFGAWLANQRKYGPYAGNPDRMMLDLIKTFNFYQ